ncbi:MAG: hypothetical protein QOE70_4063 [Chthoniobacter sp.]|nr:hypothetical protein [Chthoniobacter sp.]
MKTIKYPVVLEEDGKRVTIRKLLDHGSETFRLEYQFGGQRRMKTRADQAEAHTDAARILAMLNERAPVFAQTEDATIYRAAKTVLRGVAQVDEACREYALAVAALKGVSIMVAVKAYLAGQPAKSKDTPALVAQFLKGVERSAKWDYYKSMRSRLQRFTRTFTGPISAIKKDGIDDWLDGLAVSPRSRNNERTGLVTFFRWARGEGYLPDSIKTEPEKLKRQKTFLSIDTFTPQQAAKLMAAVVKMRPELIAYTAIGLFAGVRPTEIVRLDFSEIRWNHGDIEVPAEKAKTGGRRLVEMKENLKAWLAPSAAKTFGPVAPRYAARDLAKVARRAGLQWTPDVMRHSFISSAVAVAQQIGQVALWAGNSEAIIKKHYLKRMTKEEGAAFFAIMPEGASNVVPMRAAV